MTDNKNVKPFGYFLPDQGGNVFTRNESDIRIARSFNWEVIPLFSQIPDDHLHVSEFIDLCKSFSSRTSSIYIADVEAALHGILNK